MRAARRFYEIGPLGTNLIRQTESWVKLSPFQGNRTAVEVLEADRGASGCARSSAELVATLAAPAAPRCSAQSKAFNLVRNLPSRIRS